MRFIRSLPNNNLKKKIGALESERTDLMAQIYKAKYQIKKLNKTLESIFKFINIHASHLMDKLPKFVIKLVKQYGKKQNEVLDLKTRKRVLNLWFRLGNLN
jgi:chromosome condensin MukBEF ATPase and DNA-binding subunit MukB